jgi:hypothetical protein
MSTRVTEKKRIKIDRECKDNPVFVTWINTLGGREQWLFHKVQTEGLQTENRGTFEPYVEDLELSRGQIMDIEIFAQPQLIVYAQVLNEDIQGLKSILYSPNVEVLVNPLTWEIDDPKWQIYRPQPGSFKIIDTDEIRTDIEITFNNPYINNVKQ